MFFTETVRYCIIYIGDLRMFSENKLKEIRKRTGMSQEQLAELVGVSLMTIRRWEWGETSPSAKKLPKLAEALNTSVEYLMGLTDDAPPPVKQELPINNMKEHHEHIDMAYWGGVLDNMRRLAKSETNPSDIALITAMLKSGIEELSNSKINRTQSAGVVVSNYHGYNNIETINI